MPKKVRQIKNNEATLWPDNSLSSRRVIVPGSQLFYLGWFILVAGLIVVGVFLLAPLLLSP